jgi:hypothetical protein
MLAATMEEDGGSFEEDDNQPIGEECSVHPHAPEQPDGEYSEGGESSYGSGDDSESDLESSAPAALTKKRQKTSSWANKAKVQAALAKTKKAVADLNQLKKTHARLTNMHEALDSKHDKLKREIVEGKKATAREMQLSLNFTVLVSLLLIFCLSFVPQQTKQRQLG